MSNSLNKKQYLNVQGNDIDIIFEVLKYSSTASEHMMSSLEFAHEEA